MNSNRIINWRYLDSLDSTRYSDTQFFYGDIPSIAEKKLNFEQARIEVCVTILMGHGIVVPNNQLIDSFGFLHIASDMIKAAKQYTHDNEKTVFLPLRYANYDYKEAGLTDPFLLAAYLFDRKDFELSTWPELDLNTRKDWAKTLRQYGSIPDRYVTTEGLLVKYLIRVLQFFKLHPENVIPATSTGDILQSMLSSIANLSIPDLESIPFFSKILTAKASSEYEGRIAKTLGIINAIKAVTDDIKEAGGNLNRTVIRKYLQDYRDKYFQVDSPRKACIGTLKTIDSIQNFMLYKATGAQQDNQTEPMDKDDAWGYDEAAFALGQWARENHMTTPAPSRISSNNDSFITKRDFPVGDKNIEDFWNHFFDFRQDTKFETSMTRYINQLQILRSDQEKSRQELEKYRNLRNRHLEVIGNFLPKDYKIVTQDEKAFLECYEDQKLSSKIEIEDFAENADMKKELKDAIYAGEVATNISTKGRIADFDR